MSHHIDKKTRKYSTNSLLIHGKFVTKKWDFSHHVVPPMSTSVTYRLDSIERAARGFNNFANPAVFGHRTPDPIYIYERLDEPVRGMLEDNLAFAEGGDCAITFASGMAAVSAACGIFLKSGHEIISHKTIYGCTYSLFTTWYPKYNINVRFTDMTNPENIRKFVNNKTKIVYFETPTNPTMDVIDIASVVKIVKDLNKTRRKEERIYTIVDNTFATPFCQRPLLMGVDLVLHSLTKNIGGFGTDVGGAVITRDEFESPLMLYRKDFGGQLASKTAWTIYVYGLPTLSMRVKRQQESAKKVVEFLRHQEVIEYVRYPGIEGTRDYEIAKRQMIDFDGEFAPGNMIAFKIAGKPDEAHKKAKKVMNYIAKNAYTLTLAVSLGQLRTLIDYPSAMTHATIPLKEQPSHGIIPGLIRLSVGSEEPKDIISDLSEALSIIK
ncbi:MAG: aminotransferase class I/II-fold pyridoxal phosphate-dependent enzyme [Deltaproteobacteria bacterium]|nr:aminotransferase class I/II-fold pyridoxal phosphate-dependent enzyme [Deltaproteobacteria bacterium]